MHRITHEDHEVTSDIWCQSEVAGRCSYHTQSCSVCVQIVASYNWHVLQNQGELTCMLVSRHPMLDVDVLVRLLGHAFLIRFFCYVENLEPLEVQPNYGDQNQICCLSGTGTRPESRRLSVFKHTVSRLPLILVLRLERSKKLLF